MDPQKNTPNSSFDEGQALSAQDGQQPLPSQPAPDPANEVTVNFNQDQAMPQPATQPGGNDMPSITPDLSRTNQSAVTMPPTDPAMQNPAQPFGTQPGTVSAAPQAGQPPMTPQDPYATPAPQVPAPAIQNPQPFDTQTQPQPLGQPDANQGVPPTAPAPATKADKKTVIILGVVAVVLVAAIAVLIFL